MTDRQAQKDRLLIATLDHVPFDGWGRRALHRAATDLDLDPASVRRLFPLGTESLLAWFDDWADRAMLVSAKERGLDELKVRERITALVRCRLEVLSPHREATRRAILARSLPSGAYVGCQTVWTTVDRMWAAAGFAEKDGFSYYSRRALLTGVYVATVLFWLEDKSENFEDSWAFLDRRIGDIMEIQKTRSRFQERWQGLRWPMGGPV
ncbi:MAG: COQ9 family protein [Geminicoccaceae bacterium]